METSAYYTSKGLDSVIKFLYFVFGDQYYNLNIEVALSECLNDLVKYGVIDYRGLHGNPQHVFYGQHGIHWDVEKLNLGGL